MNSIRYTELFYSLQGEGRYVGAPSIFLRTFGCNFRCKNFGRYEEHIIKGKNYNPEVIKIINEKDLYATYEDLPLVKTGCDTYASIYPEFKEYAKNETIDAIVERIHSLLPHNGWKREHLVITGGEPLLGWQKAYPVLLNHPFMTALQYLTFETNGTQMLSREVQDAFDDLEMSGLEFTFSVSAKLPCSGEKWEDAIKPKVIEQYQKVACANGSQVYLKFVVANEKDVEDAEKAHKELGQHLDVYLMPVGGTEESYYLNNRQVAQIALDRGWKYSPRLQVDLWKNEWGT